MSSAFGLQVPPSTGCFVKTVAVPSNRVSLAWAGSEQSRTAPGLRGSNSVRRSPVAPVRCQRMKSPVRRRGSKPRGASLASAALVVTTQSKSARVRRLSEKPSEGNSADARGGITGTSSQSNLALIEVARYRAGISSVS